MIQNFQVARYDFIFKDGAGWDVDSVTVDCYDDNSTFQSNVSSKLDITSNRQVIQLQNVWDVFKTTKEIFHLFEIVTQLD